MRPHHWATLLIMPALQTTGWYLDCFSGVEMAEVAQALRCVVMMDDVPQSEAEQHLAGVACELAKRRVDVEKPPSQVEMTDAQSGELYGHLEGVQGVGRVICRWLWRHFGRMGHYTVGLFSIPVVFHGFSLLCDRLAHLVQ